MIQILDPQVIDQIAAGEVVERPAHLVKELVENSLDAGSTQIIAELFEGGRKVIITDNGRGMPPKDLALALERFATSKITQIDDIWKLSSFGFRGEALASIASVSEVKLVSKFAGEDEAFSLSSTFGKKSEVKPASLQKGTQIVIDRLFENVPARLKFLKTDGAELVQIKTALRGLALANPHVEFQIKENGKLLFLWTPQDSLLERAKNVLGEEKLYAMQYDKHGFQIDLVYSDPSLVFRSSKNIWIFVQDRSVQDRAIQAAMMEAYRSLLMHGEYPMIAIKLKVPLDFVDVNVHPTKSQVKFQDSSVVYRIVHAVLRRALEEAPWSPNYRQQAAGNSEQPRQQAADHLKAQSTPAPSPQTSEPTNHRPQTSYKFQGSTFESTVYRKKDLNLQTLSQMAESRRDYVVEPRGGDATESQRDSVQRSQQTSSLNESTTPAPTPGFWGSLDVIGQLHLTYIVAQSADRLFLIDQHAAHERVRYETLIETWKGKKIDIQNFLFPQALDLSPEMVEALMPFISEFEKFGLSFEELGPGQIGIQSAPSLLSNFSFQKIFEQVAGEIIDRGGSFSFDEKVSHLCATMACHSVVRAGQALSHGEMKSLLSEMDEFALSEFCPHGRPVAVEMGTAEIERLFGRRG